MKKVEKMHEHHQAKASNPPAPAKPKKREKKLRQFGGEIYNAVGSHYFPTHFPPMPTEDRYNAELYDLIDQAYNIEDMWYARKTTDSGATYQTGAMAVGCTNPHYPMAQYVPGDTNAALALREYGEAGPDFLVRPSTQSPELGTMASMRLHAITMEINFYRTRITDGGYCVVGLVPEAEGVMAEVNNSDQSSYFAALNGRVFSKKVLITLKGVRIIPVSKLVGTPFTIVGHPISPSSEKFKDPSTQSIAGLTERQFKKIDAVADKSRVRADVLKAYLKLKGQSKPTFLPEDAGVDIGFWLVDDIMVPFCIWIPDQSSMTEMLNPPQIKVSRSWLCTRHVADKNADLPGDFGTPPVVVANAVTSRMSERTRRAVNKLSQDLPLVQAPTGLADIHEIVNHLCNAASQGIDWATSAEGQKVLKLGTQLLGYGAQAALLAL